MNLDVRNDTHQVLKKSIVAIRDRDAQELNRISNETIHNASIYQDRLSLDTAIVMYAISKLIMNCAEDACSIDPYISYIQQANDALHREDDKAFEHILHELMERLEKDDKSITKYIHHILHQAKVKKSAKLYDHGISIAQSAKTLGISQWELYGYIGKTRMNDGDGVSVSNMKKRLKYAEAIFSP